MHVKWTTSANDYIRAMTADHNELQTRVYDTQKLAKYDAQQPRRTNANLTLSYTDLTAQFYWLSAL